MRGVPASNSMSPAMRKVRTFFFSLRVLLHGRPTMDVIVPSSERIPAKHIMVRRPWIAAGKLKKENGWKLFLKQNASSYPRKIPNWRQKYYSYYDVTDYGKHVANVVVIFIRGRKMFPIKRGYWNLPPTIYSSGITLREGLRLVGCVTLSSV